MLVETDAGLLVGSIDIPDTPEYVVAELRHDSRIAYSSRGFSAPGRAEEEAQSLNKTLEGYRVQKIQSQFGMAANAVRRRSVAAPSRLGVAVNADFAQAGFVQIRLRDPKDAEALAKRLSRQKDVVWNAVVAPRPVPAAVATGASAASRNFEPSQGYLHSAPNGIDAAGVWPQRGGLGQRITVCDIEGNWNLRHEDLPRNIRRLGGTVINTLGWRNHGTAVLGEIISRRNNHGTIGIAHGARGAVHSAIVGGVWNTAAAIRNTARHVRAATVATIRCAFSIGGALETPDIVPRLRPVVSTDWSGTCQST